MRFFSTLLDILAAGLDGATYRVRTYGELLVERIRTEEAPSEKGREQMITALRRVLDRDAGQGQALLSSQGMSQRALDTLIPGVSDLNDLRRAFEDVISGSLPPDVQATQEQFLLEGVVAIDQAIPTESLVKVTEGIEAILKDLQARKESGDKAQAEPEQMRPFLVFINHLFATHTHLYSLQAADQEQAKQLAYAAFEQYAHPDEPTDWQVTAFEPQFLPLPYYIARVDREI